MDDAPWKHAIRNPRDAFLLDLVPLYGHVGPRSDLINENRNCAYLRLLFSYDASMFPMGEFRLHSFVIGCQGCLDNIPAPVERFLLPGPRPDARYVES